MKEVLFKILDKFTEKVDTYHNNGSMWFIFTDDKKWVIELTKEGTLWYNFYFFQDCFKYLSLDVVENQHYITEWVEDTLQNGVRDTRRGILERSPTVEYTLQNGVRDTRCHFPWQTPNVEDTLQNGIKETHEDAYHNKGRVDGVIRNGIKETNWRKVDNHPTYLDHILIEK